MRVVVTGTSGAGKTTLARNIAAALTMPHIELDAINWQPGWRDLTRHDPEEFVRRVNTSIAAEAWVVDGNYWLVRDIVWRRATHLVWLDYERRVIMARVIRRTIVRATLRTELWSGNRERWRHLLRPSHPIRWAWNTWERRRRETAERLGREDYAELVVLRLRHPRETRQAIALLAEHRAAELRPSSRLAERSNSSALRSR
jgi:adenylate kinase family enzyme